MREIKFRVWNKTSKEFTWFDTPYFTCLNDPKIGFKNVKCEKIMLGDYEEAQQFTGLLDKNGKEAYFQDLVKLKGSDEVFRIVQDDFAIPCFVGENCSQVIDFKDWFAVMRKDAFEIIGNIYDKKDLIEE